MNTNSRNWGCARKAQWLVTTSLLLLQNFLVLSEILAGATSSVHIVYMGDKVYDSPDTTRKYHHKMLSSLLGRSELLHTTYIHQSQSQLACVLFSLYLSENRVSSYCYKGMFGNRN